MTGFVAELDADAATGAEEAAAGGNGSFPPLPAGKYQARVQKVVEVQEWGGTGANSKKKVVKIQVQIFDNSPTGAKRVYFTRIPLFSRFAPNEKNPKGAVARAFWDFWEKAMGWPREHILAGQMPGPSDIQGKPLTITLGAPLEPDQWNPLGSNEVEFFDAPGDIAATPQTPVRVPWLDDHGNLRADYVPRNPGNQQGAPVPPQGAPSAPPQWNQPQAAQPPAYAQPQQATQPPQYALPAYAQPQPQAAAAPGQPPAWAPAAADVAYAGANALQQAADAQASGY